MVEPLPEFIHQLANRVMVEQQVRVESYELSLISIRDPIECEAYQIMLHLQLILRFLNRDSHHSVFEVLRLSNGRVRVAHLLCLRFVVRIIIRLVYVEPPELLGVEP